MDINTIRIRIFVGWGATYLRSTMPQRGTLRYRGSPATALFGIGAKRNPTKALIVLSFLKLT
jgi:hypothetical protein